MGRRYEYRLDFPRSQLKDMLRAVGNMADQTIVLPKQEIHLHSSPLFVPDPAIFRYYWEEMEAGRGSPGTSSLPLNYDHGMAIRSIGIHVYPVSIYNPHLAEIRFTASTTRMSLLFEESTSIRQTFVHLLTSQGGLCAIFEDPDFHWFSTLVIWPEGYNWEEVRADLLMAFQPSQ